VAENESESHTTDQTDIVDNLHYSLESASSFKEHLHSHTLDYHDILINLLLGCSNDTDNDVSLCLPQRAWRMPTTSSSAARRFPISPRRPVRGPRLRALDSRSPLARSPHPIQYVAEGRETGSEEARTKTRASLSSVST